MGSTIVGRVALTLGFLAPVMITTGASAELAFPACDTSSTCRQAFCSVGSSVGNRRYVVSGAVVVDNASGQRLWQRGFSPPGNFQAAVSYCSALSLEGISGWHVPTNTELRSIVLKPGGLRGGPDACLPSIDQSAFTSPDGDGVPFWTSTLVSHETERQVIDFSDGRGKVDSDDDATPLVRCVHDPL